MKKSKFVSSLTYVPGLASNMETVPGKSMTIAGESYTVQELFERHLSGQMPNVRDESYWQDTADFDAIDFQALKHADPFEKAELLQEVQTKAAKAQKALEEWQANQAPSEVSDDDEPKPKVKSKSKDASESGEQGSKRSDATDASSDERTTSDK